MLFLSLKDKNIAELSLDGIEYKIIVSKHTSNSGYAPIIIKDLTNEETFISDGYIEINNHIFISKWKFEYSISRENYVPSKELILEIV